jgi:ABC-type multidrug transport system fused ATPase/permease subunit
MEESTQALNLRMSELHKQLLEKDLIITELNKNFFKLSIELKEYRTLNNQISHLNENSADVIVANNEMLQFWVNTGIKTALVIAVVIGVYSIFNGFSIMSIIKLPFAVFTPLTNYVTNMLGWHTISHRYLF